MKTRYKFLFSAFAFITGLVCLNKINVFAKDISSTETTPPVIDNDNSGDDNDYTKDEDISIEPVTPTIYKNQDAINYYNEQKYNENLDDLVEYYAKQNIVLDRDCYNQKGGKNYGSCLVLTQEYFNDNVKKLLDFKDYLIANKNSIAQLFTYFFNGLKNNGVLNSDGSVNSSFAEGMYSFGKDLEDVIQNNMKDPTLDNNSDSDKEEQLPDNETDEAEDNSTQN